MERPALSIVIPCYNEQDVLAELHRRLGDAIRDYGSSCEVVLVNDGSKDGTWPLLQSLAAKDRGSWP